MKKIFALLMAVMMIMAFAACGDDDAAKEKDANKGEAAETEAKVEATNGFDGSKYNLDLTAEGVQPMSEERAMVEVLAETAKDWLGGATLHSYSADKKTYVEFVEHIGCEPSEYQYDAKNNYRTFIWHAADNDTAWFSAFFEEKDGKWELYATSSANLGI